MKTKSGPTDKVREFLYAMTPRLRGFLHIFLQDVNEMEDAIQEIFIKYITHGPEPDDRNAAAWILKTARNHALDVIKTSRHRRERERVYGETKPDGAPIDPIANAIMKEEHKKIRECLEKLPLDLREPLFLKIVESLSFTKISTRIGSPRSSVAVKVRRGLILLNRCFQGNLDEV